MQDVGREKVKNQPLDDSFRLMEKLVSNVRSEALPEQPRKRSTFAGLVRSSNRWSVSSQPPSISGCCSLWMQLVCRMRPFFKPRKTSFPRGSSICALGVLTARGCTTVSEALWFFLNCAFATKSYEQTCADWIIATIGNEQWEATNRADVASASQPKTLACKPSPARAQLCCAPTIRLPNIKDESCLRA